jgi:hypothetical protein
MAKSLQLPAIQPFSVHEDLNTVRQRWKRWREGLEFYMAASAITEKSQKRAVLLHLAGEEVQAIFATLENTGDDYATALDKLNTYFEPKHNLSYDRHVFRQLGQEQGETVNTFVTRLREAVKSCEFDKYSNPDAIKDQIIDKCTSSKLRRVLLRTAGLTLDRAFGVSASNGDGGQSGRRYGGIGWDNKYK